MLTLVSSGIRNLMVEGGAGVITSFLSSRLVDLLVLTIAPVLVGGQRSLETRLDRINNGSRETTFSNGSQYPGFRHFDYMKLGNDLVLWGSLGWESE
jgi:riboflavin biosynthesis pyrimidine reductase